MIAFTFQLAVYLNKHQFDSLSFFFLSLFKQIRCLCVPLELCVFLLELQHAEMLCDTGYEFLMLILISLSNASVSFIIDMISVAACYLQLFTDIFCAVTQFTRWHFHCHLSQAKSLVPTQVIETKWNVERFLACDCTNAVKNDNAKDMRRKPFVCLNFQSKLCHLIFGYWRSWRSIIFSFLNNFIHFHFDVYCIVFISKVVLTYQ